MPMPLSWGRFDERWGDWVANGWALFLEHLGCHVQINEIKLVFFKVLFIQRLMKLGLTGLCQQACKNKQIIQDWLEENIGSQLKGTPTKLVTISFLGTFWELVGNLLNTWKKGTYVPSSTVHIFLDRSKGIELKVTQAFDFYPKEWFCVMLEIPWRPR